MEKILRGLAHKISLSLGYDSEKEAVIAYGLFAMMQIGITIVLAFLFGLIVGAPVEAMIVCFSVSIFRKYSGGAHAHDAMFCTVISVVYCTFAAWLSKQLIPIYHPYAMFIAIALVYGLVFWITYRYAPVDSPNKPIKSEQKIKRMRKGSFIILSTYMALQLFFYGASSHWPAFLSYGISLLLGIGWQAFTLTPLGAILLGKRNVVA
ncbi:MAG: accessory gene regulator B family protein [Clostridiales bacterium]|nr:accessory gene regulator B family protein [Clostridiales bacterium]